MTPFKPITDFPQDKNSDVFLRPTIICLPSMASFLSYHLCPHTLCLNKQKVLTASQCHYAQSPRSGMFFDGPLYGPLFSLITNVP